MATYRYSRFSNRRRRLSRPMFKPWVRLNPSRIRDTRGGSRVNRLNRALAARRR